MALEPSDWSLLLEPLFQSDAMRALGDFLRAQNKKGKAIYPPSDRMFAALNATPFEKVKVLLLGQDPYHGENQANGLAFSVPKGVKVPPSLVNIYKELDSDLGIKPVNHGDLQTWAQRGVLLLNRTLSVEANIPASHYGKGWEILSAHIIKTLSARKQGVAFVLWGAKAQEAKGLIDRTKHRVFASAHPSPLSAYRGFFGSRPFSKVNTYLQSVGKTPIDWDLSS